MWGLGYIGFTTAAHFAAQGIHVLGTDIDHRRVRDVRKGRATIPNLHEWLGFDTRYLVESGLLNATEKWAELLHPPYTAHFIAVPTERDGQPWSEPLRDVCGKIKKHWKDSPRPLVIVESTMTLADVEDILLDEMKDFPVAVANRRDWFGDASKNLRTIPRVIGGSSPEVSEEVAEICRIVTDVVHIAPSIREAVLVKAVENAMRHLDISFINQLSLAYPDMDVREVARLAGTKWNMNTYFPSAGTGGYCIPVGPLYVLKGAKDPSRLGLLKEAMTVDNTMAWETATSFISRGVHRVLILGACYKGDIPVTVLSPTFPIAHYLMDTDITVGIHDPYPEAQQAIVRLGLTPEKWPECLTAYDGILIITDHRMYRSIPDIELRRLVKDTKFILDSPGVWAGKDLGEVEYKQVGEANWR